MSSRNFKGIRSVISYDITNYQKISAHTIKAHNVISDNIQTSIFTSDNINTIVNTPIVQDGTYTVDPFGVHNYIIAFDIIDNGSESINFTLDANTELSTINDKVILMFKLVSSGISANNVNMTLTDKFYYTYGGDVLETYNIKNLERLVIEFIYDGEKFVNTYDN